MNLELGKHISGFEPRAIEMLHQYDWPNNYTQQSVTAHNGNRAAAARQLGISRTTLWRYLGKSEGGG